MKSTRLTSIFYSSLIAFALTIGSLASTHSPVAQPLLAKVNIPFAFQTPTRTLPAGIYLIHRDSENVIRLEGPGSVGGYVVIYETDKPHADNRTVIVFNQYGDKYFLRQIWTPENNVAFGCPKSLAESVEAKNNQASTSKVNSVIVSTTEF